MGQGDTLKEYKCAHFYTNLSQPKINIPAKVNLNEVYNNVPYRGKKIK